MGAAKSEVLKITHLRSLRCSIKIPSSPANDSTQTTGKFGNCASNAGHLSEKELLAYKEAAKIFLDLNESELKKLILTKKIKEVKKS